MVDSTAMGSRDSLVQRMIRAARLDASLYEEVEADRTATRDAAIAVTLVAVATGIGSALAGAFAARPEGMPAPNPLIALIIGIVGSLLGWLIWSYVTYFIGTRMFGGRATPGEMLRTIGFAQSPGILNLFSFVPFLGPILSLVVGIWSLVAGVVAVRQALDFTTGKAILTTVLGWIFLIIIPLVLALLGLGGLSVLTGG